MKTQQGAYPVKRRSTIPSNPHNFGHSAGIHPEDQPYDSTDLEEDDRYYETRPPTSARRYVTTDQQRVIQRGNKRIIVHNEPPPKRSLHWSLILGLGMLLMIGFWVGGSYVINWW